MSVKRRCHGCGCYVDYEFGRAVKCRYCGTKFAVSFNEDAYERIQQANKYRINGDFEACIDILDKLIQEYPESSELRFGRFLATYEVTDTDQFLSGKENILCIEETSVEDNEDYCLAVQLEEENPTYHQIGRKIEAQRLRNVTLSQQLHCNSYMTMILSNSHSCEDELAKHLYSQLCKHVDVFYANVTADTLDEADGCAATLLACDQVSSLYLVIKDLNEVSPDTLKVVRRFLQNHDGVCFSIICDDEKRSSEIYKNAARAFSFSKNCCDAVLEDIILTAPLSFDERFEFMETKYKIANANNPSPKIKI